MYKVIKYNNYYFKNKYIRSSVSNSVNFKNLEDAKNFIKNVKLNYIENKKDISVFESIQCVINSNSTNYKIFYKYINKDLKMEVSNLWNPFLK